MSIDLSSSSQPEREEEPVKPRDFDEKAFLSGQVAIFGDEPKPWSPKRECDFCVFLSPVCGQRPWMGDYKTPSIRASVPPSMCPLVTFLHKP